MDTGKLSNDSDSLDIIKDNVSVTLDGMWFATGPVGPSWVTRGGDEKISGAEGGCAAEI